MPISLVNCSGRSIVHYHVCDCVDCVCVWFVTSEWGRWDSLHRQWCSLNFLCFGIHAHFVCSLNVCSHSVDRRIGAAFVRCFCGAEVLLELVWSCFPIMWYRVDLPVCVMWTCRSCLCRHVCQVSVFMFAAQSAVSVDCLSHCQLLALWGVASCRARSFATKRAALSSLGTQWPPWPEGLTHGTGPRPGPGQAHEWRVMLYDNIYIYNDKYH